MEAILGKVTQQAMNYAIRSGVTLTASYAIKQSSKLLNNVPKSDIKDELAEVQRRLEHKIRVVSPAIDMIELIAARGNTSLESAVSLTTELRLSIQKWAQRLAKAASSSAEYAVGSSRHKAKLSAEDEKEMQLIIIDTKTLLNRIEDAVPLINLALTTSGAKLSTQLPSTVSPSRLLQASTFLTAGDTQYALSPHRVAQIGPTFTLSVYMLFTGHDRPQTEEEIRNTTWKEVIHKARLKLRRVPLDIVLSTGSGSDALQSHQISSSHGESPAHIRAEHRSDEYAYQMMIVEDLDDDRHHDFESDEAIPTPFDDIQQAGIREMIPVHEISKIFYADTSKVLNIGMDAEANHPVLLLRRDVQAVPPRKMVHREILGNHSAIEPTTESDAVRLESQEQDYQTGIEHANRKRDPWLLPPSLDPEWIAFEVYTETDFVDEESDQEDDEETVDDSFQGRVGSSDTTDLSLSMSSLQVNSPLEALGTSLTRENPTHPWTPQIKTSLSMLELLLRLTSLQQFQQQSHLSIPDELLNFFLEESASTGAGGDEQHRQAIRADARRRVGWDPYDESPLKRRGEEYQHMDQQSFASHAGGDAHQYNFGNEAVVSSPATSLRSPTTPPVRNATTTPDIRRDASVKASPVSSQRNMTLGNRSQWLKRQTTVPSSPLRSNSTHKDEGIGTSPASTPEIQQ